MDNKESFSAKSKTLFEKKYDLGGYTFVPAIFSRKILLMLTKPEDFWATTFATITDGELILGLGTLTVLSSTLSGLAHFSPALLLSGLVTAPLTVGMGFGDDVLAMGVQAT